MERSVCKIYGLHICQGIYILIVKQKSRFYKCLKKAFKPQPFFICLDGFIPEIISKFCISTYSVNNDIITYIKNNL